MGASYHRATCYVKHYLAVYPNPNGWTMYLATLYLIGGTTDCAAALIRLGMKPPGARGLPQDLLNIVRPRA